jgi:hypothetical protein
VGDKIEANIGDEAENIIVGNRNRQNVSENTNKTNVYLELPKQSRRKDNLSMSAEERLEGELFALRKDMNALSLSIGRLDQTLSTTVAFQFEVANKRIVSLEEAVAQNKKAAESQIKPSVTRLIMSATIIVCILLTVICLLLAHQSNLV